MASLVTQIPGTAVGFLQFSYVAPTEAQLLLAGNKLRLECPYDFEQ